MPKEAANCCYANPCIVLQAEAGIFDAIPELSSGK